MYMILILVIIVLGAIIYYLYELNSRIVKKIDGKLYYQYSKLNRVYKKKYDKLKNKVNNICDLLDKYELEYNGDDEENKDQEKIKVV